MKVDVWTTHSLDKLFPETEPPARPRAAISLKAAANESEDAQVAVRAGPGTTLRRAAFSFTPLTGPDGHRLETDCLEAWWQWYVYVQRNPPKNRDPASWLRTAPAFFPDAFLEEREVSVAAEWTQPLWVRVRVPAETPPGTYAGALKLSFADQNGDSLEQEIPLSVTVWPLSLPADKGLHHTEWFDPEVLAHYYRLEPWSEVHWAWIDRVFADMAVHHQDMVLTRFEKFVTATPTPAGGQAYDFQRLDRWLELMQRHGIVWLEGGHVATRAGDWTGPFAWKQPPGAPAGDDWAVLDESARAALVEPFVKAVYAHLENRWPRQRIVQHIADEPLPENLDSWQRIAGRVRAWLPGVRLIDAAMCEGIVGDLEIRVPQLQTLKANPGIESDEELWSYVCLVPQGHHPNRFLDFASIRNRIIFWLSFSMRLRGFLHWGYAHWASWVPHTPKTVDISPWTDATGGSIYAHDRQPLPAGDPHIVYPGRAGICSSIRWEVVRKGIEDFALLQQLEAAAVRDGGASEAGRDALALLEWIRDEVAQDSEVYTRDPSVLLAARELAGDLLATLLAG